LDSTTKNYSIGYSSHKKLDFKDLIGAK
jgi:hypothetical protein